MLFTINAFFLYSLITLTKIYKINYLNLFFSFSILILGHYLISFNSYLLNAIFCLLLFFISFSILYKNLFAGGFSSLVYFGTLAISSILVSKFTIFDYHIALSDSSISTIPFLIISTVLFLVVIFFFGELTLNKNKTIKNIIFANNSLITLVIIIIYIFKEIDYINDLGLNDHYFYIIIYLIVQIFFYGTLIGLLIYSKLLVKDNDLNLQLSIKRHDIATLMNTLNQDVIKDVKNAFSNDGIDGVLEITNKYLGSLNKEVNQETFPFDLDQNIAIFINHKIDTFPDIITNVYTKKSNKKLSFNKEYFFEILGIILDNAYEGAMESTYKNVTITIQNNSIKICNSYNFSDVRLFKNSKSKKGDINRINGLKLLTYLVDKTDITILRTINEKICIEMVAD